TDWSRLGFSLGCQFQVLAIGDLSRLGWRWLIGFCRPEQLIALHPVKMRGASVAGFADFCDRGKKLLLARDTRPRIGDIFDNLSRITISKNSRDSGAISLRVVRLILSVTGEQ